MGTCAYQNQSSMTASSPTIIKKIKQSSLGSTKDEQLSQNDLQIANEISVYELEKIPMFIANQQINSTIQPFKNNFQSDRIKQVMLKKEKSIQSREYKQEEILNQFMRGKSSPNIRFLKNELSPHKTSIQNLEKFFQKGIMKNRSKSSKIIQKTVKFGTDVDFSYKRSSSRSLNTTFKKIQVQ